MIQLSDVWFKYDNANTETLKGVHLAMNQGQVLAVVGPSGGGKSTLLRILAGLERPSKGTMVMDGETIFSDHLFVNPDKRGVGMVFQDYALFPHMTVEKNIDYGLFKLAAGEKKRRISEVLKLVNLEGFEKRYPHEMSGGQQQRIALARALAPRPKVLLLDEPFSNLDTHLLEKVRDELFDIIRASGTTTVMVTHNPEDARSQADEIISIVEGVAEIIDI